MTMNLVFKVYCIFLCMLVLLLVPQNSTAQKYQTLGTAGCGLGQNNCHAGENTRWYRNDAHKVTVEALYDDMENAEKYAELAGIGAKNLFKGNTNCMECHGTIVSGKEAKEADEGVSCESCHGPGSGYKDPHSEKDVGYEKALKLGLVKNENLDIRAKTCVRCHYITDQKVLAAGHPTGEKFNYISGIKKVAGHWKRVPGQNELGKAPFDNAKKAKGPIAKIAEIVRDSPAKPKVDSTPSPTQIETDASPPPRPSRPRAVGPPAPCPVDPIAIPENVGPLDLPPFPAVSDSMSIQEVILILKKRLELLYQKTGGR